MRVVTDLPHRVREIENTWVPLPGTDERMAARIFLPEGAGAHHRFPAILEYLPYRKRDFTALRDTSMHRYFAGHGYVAVRIDMRGSGDVGRPDDRRIPGPGTPGRQGCDRLARGAAMVRWQRRNHGQQLGRLQRSADRRTSAARAESRDHVVLDRRPVRRRHALDGRHAADRHARLGCELLDVDRPSAGPADRRRAVARDVAGPPRPPQLHGRGLAAPPAPRRVLEARLRERGLLEHRGARVRGRWLARRIFERHPAVAGKPDGAPAGTHRPMGPRLSAHGHTRPAVRLPARSRPVLGPVAQGRGQRDHAGADAPGLDAREDPGALVLRHVSGPLGGGNGMALTADRGAPASAWPMGRCSRAE